ncbi:pyridoxal-dependent decarboxylase [Protomyces lactucae-debilis]|uniref:Ornithine decarboxylase n=1 Tax=Protomyces lactucae-debilis TaxID=2754530 RepID=A0A1Y2FU80_PROLT|nr:pyridoxal-dependent decarboxylase [Protomyces lactucae-debilis]ORY87538.1 pyridoxal-dependent decarboxylase [Protomyces lactucae-debilis]
MPAVDFQVLSPNLAPNFPDKPSMAPAPLLYNHVAQQIDAEHNTFPSNPARACVKRALEDQLARIEHEGQNPDNIENGAAFFVADLGEIVRQHLRWQQNLPRVVPHYAVKCNPDNQVIRLLAALGTGFDCASKAEIQQVLDLGVSPDRIIYANPCKAASYIRYAGAVGVQATTFDNAEELHKIANYNPEAQLFLRILTDDSGALCQLGLKYGAPLNTTMSLLKLAKELKLNVVGVSFHVGSGSSDPMAFVDAVQRARIVFDEAAAVGFTLHTLDIGGGFGHDNFEKFAAVLGPAIDEHFPADVRVIAEPGRYYVAAAFTLAVHIIARRTIYPDSDEPLPGTTSNNFMYYVNDGVYGSFNCIMFDHQHPVPKVLMHKGRSYFDAPAKSLQKQRVRCSIWGPTCDSLDCITGESYLPFVMQVGDWLYFDEMGAYTKCASSKFNGFNQSEVIYVSSV